MADLPSFAETIKHLKSLKKAVIDSSSIIYMEKSGFLHLVIQHLELHSPDIVQEEINMDIDIAWHKSEILITDEAVLALAQQMAIPVISDDKKMLMKYIQSNQQAYNSLMLLHWLFLKKHISLTEHLNFLNTLIPIARYSPSVVEYGNQVFALML